MTTHTTKAAGAERPNEYGFTPHPHQHFELVGHVVRVETPGVVAVTGTLVTVGSDRLVLNLLTGLTSVHRLITTRVIKVD